MFLDYEDDLKTVTVKVPVDATGYGEIPAYYSVHGYDSTENWGNGFRGAGWDGSGFEDSWRGGTGAINYNMTLIVEYQWG
jgi:hypothetical protein